MARKQSGVQPWERQEGESTINYEAFCAYRDMGRERSLAKVGKKLGKSDTLMSNWSSKYSWVSRAADWDDEQDRIAREIAQKEMVEEIRKMRKRQAEAGKFMQVKATRALSKIPDEELKPVDISRLIEVGSKLERLARGDVGEVVEERDGGDAIPAVQIYIPDNQRGTKDDDFDDLEV